MSGQDYSRFLDLPSPAMRAVADMVDKVAPLGSTIFIQGPSGSGKEIVARAIHAKSERVNGPFVAVNCGAIPRDLLESELFGYEKGAFTGALKDRVGLMELSGGGTLFLDEIGDMPLDMQVKLLRMLEERTFTRIGGSKPISVDVRFVCATHRDLTQLIAEQKFREDLYYRINVFPIILPPLKERLADIPDLVRFIIERFEAQGFPKAPILTDGAIEALRSYEWPGNVRELRNILERAGALFVGRAIDFATMAGLIRPGQPIDRAEEAEAIWDAVAEFADDFAVTTTAGGKEDLPLRPIEIGANDDEGVRSLLSGAGGFNLKDYVSGLEVAFIRVALEDEEGSVSAAARRLGIQRTTLIEKMRKFGIGRPD